MKNKKSVFLFYVFCFCYLTINAQNLNSEKTEHQHSPQCSHSHSNSRKPRLNPEVVRNYHSSIVQRVFDFEILFPLNDLRQLQLASIFQREDSIILDALVRGLNSSEIEYLRARTKIILSNFFTGNEIEKYFISRHQLQFTDVLLMRNKIKLTKVQIDSLIKLNKEIKNNIIASDTYNAEYFERQALSHVLTYEQYNKFLSVKTKRKVLFNASKDWNEMLNLSIAKSEDSVKIFQKIVSYNSRFTSAKEQFQDNNTVLGEKLRRIEKTIPSELRDLQEARKSRKEIVPDSIKYSHPQLQW